VHPIGETDVTTGRCPFCETVTANYRDTAHWAEKTVERMHDWHFTTAGGWSDVDALGAVGDDIGFTPILHLNGGWVAGDVLDWFSPQFAEQVDVVVADQVAPHVDDPDIVGWVLDNEISWGPDWRNDATLLDKFLAMPSGSPGRQAAEAHRGDPSGFLRSAAEQFFDVTTTAVRAVDPNHLILGVRAATLATPPEVVEASGDYLDVFTVNSHIFDPQLLADLHQAWAPVTPYEPNLESYHELSGLPILVSEFAIRADDAGLPNSWPTIYITVATQKDRGTAYRDYVEPLYDAPWVVGHEWFKWVDEPPGGRPVDNEDNNFGLVSLTDEPYDEMLDVMVEVNADAPRRL
jgi:agarase